MREDLCFNWNEIDKCFELLNSKGEVSKKHLVSIADAYLREEKPPKILRQIDNPTGGIISMNPQKVIYDRYLAIDTSYKPFGGNFLCATSGLCINQHIDHEAGLLKGQEVSMFSLPRLVFLAKQGTKPERYGWMKVIEGLLRYERFNPNWSYGVVVDSDLDILQKINAGEEPIFNDFIIPDNISLIYASADSGKEVMVNKLIRATDRVAKKSLETALERFNDQESFDIPKDFWDITVLTDMVEVRL